MGTGDNMQQATPEQQRMMMEDMGGDAYNNQVELLRQQEEQFVMPEQMLIDEKQQQKALKERNKFINSMLKLKEKEQGIDLAMAEFEAAKAEYEKMMMEKEQNAGITVA